MRKHRLKLLYVLSILCGGLLINAIVLARRLGDTEKRLEWLMRHPQQVQNYYRNGRPVGRSEAIRYADGYWIETGDDWYLRREGEE